MQKHPRDINLSFESCITGAHWKTFALDHSSRPEQSELMNTAQLIKQRTKSMQNHKKTTRTQAQNGFRTRLMCDYLTLFLNWQVLPDQRLGLE